jgi:DNA repair exonuclease SbcCD ATPase subunit
MNKSQRKELGQLWDRLNTLKTAWQGLQSNLQQVKEELDEIRSSEQDRFDEMSERAQEGERGEELASTIGELESAVNGLEEFAEQDADFDSWLENIDNARGAE